MRAGSWSEQDTSELRLFWTLELTVDAEPALDELLARIVAGPLLEASDLPDVPDEARAAPSGRRDEPETLPGFDAAG